MYELTTKYATTTITLPVIADPVDNSITTGMPVVDSDTTIRVGPFQTPFFIHTDTQGFDGQLQLCIQRVVNFPAGCGFDEFKHDIPCMCGPTYLLPAGTYDINLYKQIVYPLEVGDSLDITFMVEPVSDNFALLYSKLGAS